MTTGKMPRRRKVALALAGGGAHSAFTWGVLRFLLDDLKDRIEIVAISGTSGGAMNATMLAYGLGSKEREPAAIARKLLDDFWRETSLMGDLCGNPYRHVPNPLWPSWNIDATAVPTLLNMGASLMAPAQWTPLHRNPLRLLLLSLINFDRLNHGGSFPDLYICATNVRTSQLKVFERPHISPDALCASACLPNVDWPVVIDHEPYWDGGYRADPALSPLLQAPRLVRGPANAGAGAGQADEDPVDLLLVGINPLIRDELPLTAWQIIDRANEISLNSSVIDEVKRIMMMNELLQSIDGLKPAVKRQIKALGPLRQKRRVRLHFIEDEQGMAPLGIASKNNTAWPFLEMLRDMGFQAARRWWDIEGGQRDFANASSNQWEKKIEQRFIGRHHWNSKTAPPHDPASAHTNVDTLATVEGDVASAATALHA
jgi:NTE family protein